MDLEDVSRLAGTLDGVRESTGGGGRRQWRYHGRLVARELDAGHVVLRTAFHARDVLVAESPQTFGVPRRFRGHMMVVADLLAGDQEAVEDALVAAWELQRTTD